MGLKGNVSIDSRSDNIIPSNDGRNSHGELIYTSDDEVFEKPFRRYGREVVRKESSKEKILHEVRSSSGNLIVNITGSKEPLVSSNMRVRKS